ncbi:MAG: hypothetical protein WC464_04930, partial [Bdellovibrionales bacterium]
MRLIALFAIGFVLCFTPSAKAAPLPDQACSEFGKTVIDENKQHIIACVKCSGAPACATKPMIWKTMSINYLTPNATSPATTVGCSGNQILASISYDGTPTCITPPISNISCPSGKAVAGISNG